MRVVRIGICGWGNVATGMFKAIAENKTVIEAAGVKIDIDCIGARRDNPKCNPGSVKILRIYLMSLIKILILLLS